jgi:hypothetical protein
VGSLRGDVNLSGPMGSFTRTVVAVVTHRLPSSAAQHDGATSYPAVFAVIYALISAQLSRILGLIFAPLLTGPGDTDEAFAGGVGGFLVSLTLTPIFTVFILLVWAGILHLLVRFLVSSQNAGFEATFRVSSYASVLQLLG